MPQIDQETLKQRIAELTTVLRADPASPRFVELAEVLSRAGRFGDAVAVCQRGLGRHPGHGAGLLALGRALFGAGRLEAAEQALRRRVGSGFDAEAYRLLGEVLLHGGRAGEALEALAEAERRGVPARGLSRLAARAREAAGGGAAGLLVSWAPSQGLEPDDATVRVAFGGVEPGEEDATVRVEQAELSSMEGSRGVLGLIGTAWEQRLDALVRGARPAVEHTPTPGPVRVRVAVPPLTDPLTGQPAELTPRAPASPPAAPAEGAPAVSPPPEPAAASQDRQPAAPVLPALAPPGQLAPARANPPPAPVAADASERAFPPRPVPPLDAHATRQAPAAGPAPPAEDQTRRLTAALAFGGDDDQPLTTRFVRDDEETEIEPAPPPQGSAPGPSEAARADASSRAPARFLPAESDPPGAPGRRLASGGTRAGSEGASASTNESTVHPSPAAERVTPALRIEPAPRSGPGASDTEVLPAPRFRPVGPGRPAQPSPGGRRWRLLLLVLALASLLGLAVFHGLSRMYPDPPQAPPARAAP